MKKKLGFKNFLIILTGLPASGKSTLANSLCKALNDDLGLPIAEIIDPDLIRTNLFPKEFDPKKEKKVKKLKLKKIKSVLKNGKIAICDDLNYYRSMRNDLRKIALKLRIRYFIIHVSTPLKNCLEWNKSRGNPIPNDLIIKISRKFDAFKEYKWDIPIVEIDLSKLKDLNREISRIIRLLKNSMMLDVNRDKSIIDLGKKSKKINIQEIEKITRQIVHKLLQKKYFQNYKEDILKLRKSFIETISTNSVKKKRISKEFVKYLENRLNIKLS